MKGLPSSAVSSYRPRLVILAVISAWMLFTLVVSVCSANLSSSTSAASIAHASTALPSASYAVKVFFSKSHSHSIMASPSIRLIACRRR